MNNVRECMRDQWRQSAECTVVVDLEEVEVQRSGAPVIDPRVVLVAAGCGAALWAVLLLAVLAVP